MPESVEDPIDVLIADSSPLQLQLLTSALRRRPEFNLISSTLDVQMILQILSSESCKVVILAMNHKHEALDFEL